MDLMENIKKYHLVLASHSPRRQELLKKLGLDFEIRVIPDIDETYPENIPPQDVSLYLARKKAVPYISTLQPDELLITADTVVCTDSGVLGKPDNDGEARRMLSDLSGKIHYVATGVALTTKEKQKSFSAVSSVKFAKLEPAEIDYYVEKFHPLDKAGAYGIQEWIGLVGVESLQGSFFNVMGLPVQRLYAELKKF